MKPPLRLILVRPRNPSNIGACARALANFGWEDLVVVDPYEPIWKEAKAAPGAENVLEKARAVSTWEEAVKGCGLILGTSSFHQRPAEQAIVSLPDLSQTLVRSTRKKPIAVVFGAERSGLSNEELTWCHAIIQIPTNPKTPSMNLGQAVALVLYEISRTPSEKPKLSINKEGNSLLELEPLIQTLATLAESVDYPPGYTASARLGRIRKIALNTTWNSETVRYFLSFMRWLQKQDKRNPK